MPPLTPSSRRRAGALLAACALAPAALAASADARPTLHHGDRGRSVESLQHALHLAADGVFGRGTSRAVKRFQRRRGLHADGVVGPATWAALGIGGSHPVLKRTRLRGGGRHGGSGLPSAVFRAIAAANRIAGLPYRFGGGHRS